jgi:DNA-binding NarL/FixJ family response regulator
MALEVVDGFVASAHPTRRTRRKRSSWDLLLTAINDVSRDELAWTREIAVAAHLLFRGGAKLACYSVVRGPVSRKTEGVFNIILEDRRAAVAVRPAVHRVTTLAASFERDVAVGSCERRVLARIGFYLEAAHRRRLCPEHAIGRFDEVEIGRMWSAFMTGERSIVAADGAYHVLANDSAVAARRALSTAEHSVVSLAVSGMSGKEISFELGLTPSAISCALASSAAKIGAPSVAGLLRIGGQLTVRASESSQLPALTAAEHEILALVRKGWSNDEIARTRQRSLRTIANQIASILRKTGRSRRALLVSAPIVW